MQKSKGREHRLSDRPWMKFVKYERFDEIPQNQLTDIENKWGWD